VNVDKKFLIVLGVAILALGGIFVYSSSKSDKTATNTATTVTNHSTGKLDSKVEVIEYGDFQCPACGQFFPLVNAVKERYKDRVKFTFRHFPLDSIHKNARAAARAAEAASQQGKFWEMHDLLYQNQQAWESTSDPLTVFTGYASQLGLDTEAFKTYYVSESANGSINADLKEGQSKGITGTPTFFIAGVKVDNNDLSTLEKFTAKLDKALKNAQ
jgi:protein-disulfide isomerase